MVNFNKIFNKTKDIIKEKGLEINKNIKSKIKEMDDKKKIKKRLNK